MNKSNDTKENKEKSQTSDSRKKRQYMYDVFVLRRYGKR